MRFDEMPWVAQAVIGTAIGYPLAAAICWTAEQALTTVGRWLYRPSPQIEALWQPTSLEDLRFMRQALASAKTGLDQERGEPM
ncbi:hypothetical protein [Nocardia asiatica]|uniref:hypothetical protein n=1 Tax=Nocardia asiatica TaxID=209252 RepID=UPI0024589C33|nr:hypothetical protein [Nocardia asiatica]